ncbi:hypothetical protein F2Q69_00016703 [Brassica cretica]|uniref:DUF3444 domain-containing protein n=1 Tax=Brassica cretica TaxID=69181 RepID=A0A8S9R5C4_BRACR|nr:hypothetical protein F2Q69_00016703 [Brassica cretica]
MLTMGFRKLLKQVLQKTQYEYHRVYLNQNLLCPNCRKPFIAVETDPPGSGSIRKTFHEHQFESIRQSTDGRKRSRDNNNNGVYGGEYDSFEWTATKTSAHGAQTGSRKDEAVRREYTRRVAGGATSTNAPKRRKGMDNAVAGGSNVAATCFAPKSNSVREFSDDELKNLLKKKAKPIISRKLQELAETDAHKSAIESFCLDSIEDTSGSADKDLDPLEVTDPDFCDFNKDRTEKSFRDNQIWACYDSLDGMPRGYVVIDKVISVDPFKVCIVQLTSETSSELRSTKWLGFGVQKACGNFRAGKKTQICRSAYVFSHKVEQVKGNHHGEFLIYPRRGDESPSIDAGIVWAIDSEVVPSIDVEVVPLVDVEVVLSIDVAVLVSIDAEVVPSGDVEVVSSVDVEVLPSVDVEVLPPVDVEVPSSVDVEVEFKWRSIDTRDALSTDNGMLSSIAAASSIDSSPLSIISAIRSARTFANGFEKHLLRTLDFLTPSEK